MQNSAKNSKDILYELFNGAPRATVNARNNRGNDGEGAVQFIRERACTSSISFDRSSSRYRAVSIRHRGSWSNRRDTAHYSNRTAAANFARPKRSAVRVGWSSHHRGRRWFVPRPETRHYTRVYRAHNPVLAGCQSFEVMRPDRPRLSEALSMLTRRVRPVPDPASGFIIDNGDDDSPSWDPIFSERFTFIGLAC